VPHELAPTSVKIPAAARVAGVDAKNAAHGRV
jgi:hypothetical protein